MSKINLADSFGQWADQFTETPILEQFAEATTQNLITRSIEGYL